MAGAAAAAGVSISAAALFGYSFAASSNHAFWLPGVLERLSPGLYAGDPAVAAAMRGPTLFYDALAALARPLGLPGAAALAWAASAGAVGALAWAAARALGGGTGAAGLAVLFTSLSGGLRTASPWAGDPLIKPFADHSTAAWPLVLAACVLRMGERRSAGWVLVLAAGFLNPLAAGLGAAWLLGAEALERRAAPSPADQAGGVLAALGAAVFLSAIGRGARPDLALLSAATPNTYSPWVWPWERWLHAGAWALVWLAAAWVHPERRRLLPLLLAGLGLGAAGLAAPALGPLALAQPLRIDAPLCWLGLVAAAGVLAARLADPRPAVWMTALAAAVGLAAPFAGTPLALWTAALVVFQGPLSRRAAALAGAAYGLGAPFLSPETWAGAPFSAALAAAALGLAAALAPEERGAWPVWTKPLSGAVLALWLAVGLSGAVRPPEPLEVPSSAESAARATPPGSRFAVAPAVSGFRLRARRPVCAEWTDFNLALFDAEAARAWRARMESAGADWRRLPAERAAALAEWDRALLRNRRAAAAGGIPEWTDPLQAAAAAGACGADYAVLGESVLAIGRRGR